MDLDLVAEKRNVLTPITGASYSLDPCSPQAQVTFLAKI